MTLSAASRISWTDSEDRHFESFPAQFRYEEKSLLISAWIAGV
jgi:hypothetical protein